MVSMLKITKWKDGEGKYDDGDDVDEKCDYVPCEDGEHSPAEDR